MWGNSLSNSDSGVEEARLLRETLNRQQRQVKTI